MLIKLLKYYEADLNLKCILYLIVNTLYNLYICIIFCDEKCTILNFKMRNWWSLKILSIV